MKKTVGTYLYGHIIAMALSGVASALFYTSTDKWFTGESYSAMWLLPLAFLAAMAYLVGYLLGRTQEKPLAAKDCWNTAMLFYIISLIALGLLWKMDGYELLNIWNLPLFVPMVGLNDFVGHFGAAGAEYGKFWTTDTYQNIVYPLLGLLAAAIEPMCFTLGLTRKGKKPVSAEQNENSAASSASAGAAIINEENNTNA